MDSQLISLALVSSVVAIDNALLAGMIVPWTPARQKPVIITAAGMALAMVQILLAIGVGHLLEQPAFRIGVTLMLIWMCARTLAMMPSSARGRSAWGQVWRVLLYTVVGNLDNMIWLGAEWKGQSLWLVFFSVATLPLFIVTALFLSAQCERHRWILVLGAGMMAWAAAGLILPDIRWHQMAQDLPLLAERAAVASVILAIGVLWRWWAAGRSVG
jgi:predicted tellurium resistance membrane protein TerC